MENTKDLNYYKNNCEEDYIKTPISVLRYVTELEQTNKELLEALEVNLITLKLFLLHLLDEKFTDISFIEKLQDEINKNGQLIQKHKL
jgi:hypothetical protein